MRNFIILFFFIFVSFCFAETAPDLSERIIIDGISDEFSIDENILKDTLGNLLESPTDSFWGEYNDVKQIKATWDENYLYLAVDGCSWGNNVLFFIDIYADYGIEDMSETNAWQRSFKFYNFNPDFFVGTWDTNDIPQFWQVTEGSSMTVEQITSVDAAATLNTGNLNGAMEIKITWDTLYYGGERSMQNYPSIKLLALITGSSDFSSGPDCAPDNLGGMTNDATQMIVIDNYAEILIDKDNDGNPDMSVEPNKRTSFLKRPPFEAMPLLIQNVIFTNGQKTFAPSLGEEVLFTLETNRGSDFDVEIFDLNGKFINFAENNGILNWKWNGKNEIGNAVPFGIYILRFIANSGEVSHKETVVIIK
ncbi:MAG: hypothetical protein HN952_04650 [Candidatus Cloacimonetes bacterium]|jgi:hypothetical protein|nr:hypothetical protein [Candidatus Cloacimonadota bacterium]MBT6994229.1 hypothetical protein [Candidatus Cloacimonadota bacterium]MBT7470371.1 hypothetical protein [Candidatus Cloacimonadota bacterium]